MKLTDRRVERTRKQLQQALMELIREKGYDTITIQEIVDRANVGRATFYLHYESKDALFLSSHLREMEAPYAGVFTKEEILAPEPPQSLIEIFRYVKNNRLLIQILSASTDAAIITKHIKQSLADSWIGSLKTAFPEAEYTISLDVLANYIAGSQLSLMSWWIENRVPHSAEVMAKQCHRMHRAAIFEALGASR